MWTRALKLLRCPLCGHALAGWNLAERSHVTSACDSESDAWIDTGLLACRGCNTWFPIAEGVPVLLPYATAAHGTFARDHADTIRSCAPAAVPARGRPMPGEQLVMRSFSTEWQEYDFDGVIWEMDYGDHEARFLREIGGLAPAKSAHTRFLEIGCGLGITTAMAARNLGGDAVGVDLSAAAWRAAAMHRDNPKLHFVQASVFALPFASETFDVIYTRGVLHHTYSTEEAYRKIAPLCTPGGLLYVWVYGPKSINDNLFRRTVYGIEVVMRYVLNRAPGWFSTAALAPFAASYMLFNYLRRRSNPRIQPYNYTRALHAARDRFTPEFAHRHRADEVCRWFREAGYIDIEVVDWRDMPSADHDDYRRNTGVRGRRGAAKQVEERQGARARVPLPPSHAPAAGETRDTARHLPGRAEEVR
jgi:SAM-dependent methyltransferase/uncharacterized protein YbaR (Trm112 family)